MTFVNVDIFCPNCGYNLRGLPFGNACPECGLKIISETQAVRSERIDQELEEHLEHLQQQEEAAARQQRMDDLIFSWEERGLRFDRLLDRIEQFLKRTEGH